MECQCTEEMECVCKCHTDENVRHIMPCCATCPHCERKVKFLGIHIKKHREKQAQLDWRRGLGLQNVDQIRPVTLGEAEEAYHHLYKEADLFNDMKKYGMHVALDTFITLAREELGS